MASAATFRIFLQFSVVSTIQNILTIHTVVISVSESLDCLKRYTAVSVLLVLQDIVAGDFSTLY